uniref:C-C motif chemokine n=1 Tax=Terrapene triunguis TaxID=2587831 RepID=A0A674KA73_9SAUR
TLPWACAVATNLKNPLTQTSPLGLRLNSSLSLAVGSDPPTACCFSYTARQIPRNFVKDYYSTSSMCSQPGIVFTTRKGRELCANPSESWVQEYEQELNLPQTLINL